MKALLLSTCLSIPLFAAGSTGSVEPQSQDDTFVIEVGENGMVLEDLLDLAREHLGISYFVGVEEDDLQYPLDLYGTIHVKESGFRSFFGRMLRMHDFLYHQMGDEPGAVHVIRRIVAQRGRGTGAFKALAEIVSGSELAAMSDHHATLVTTSYRTKYLPARDAVNTLQPYFADNFTDNIRNIEGTDTIIMTGFANTIVGLVALLEEIDQKPLHESVEDRALADRVRKLEARVRSLEKQSGDDQ